LSKKAGVMVCSSSSEKIQTEFSVFRLEKDKERDLIFESDTVFKRYQIEKTKEKIKISEGLKEEGEFRPFIQFEIACGKGQCKTVDTKCVWKKQPQNTAVIEELVAKEKFVDSDIQTLFVDALNGNKVAEKFLKNEIKVEAGARVAFETFQKDFKRLKKLKCKLTQTEKKSN
jgi:hypothetical protein